LPAVDGRVTWAVPAEMSRARTVEWLRGIAATAGVMRSQEGGHVERAVKEVGGTLCTTHMDGYRIRTYLRRRRRVKSAEILKTNRPGMSTGRNRRRKKPGE